MQGRIDSGFSPSFERSDDCAAAADHLQFDALTDAGDGDDVIIEGSIAKWTNYYYAWKTRHFSVAHGSLRYSQSKGSPIKCIFPLSDDTRFRVPPGEPTRLDIEYEYRTLYLKLNSIEQRRQWQDALRRAKKVNHSNRIDSLILTSAPSVSGQGSSIEEAASPDATVPKHCRYPVTTEDSTDEVDPLLLLLERSKATRDSLQTTELDIRIVQKNLIRAAGAVRDSQFRDEVKSIVLRVVELLDFYQHVVETHLRATETICHGQAAQKRKLERTVKALAKQNYALERYAARTSADPANVLREVALGYTTSQSVHGIFERAEVPAEVPVGDEEEEAVSSDESDGVDEFYDIEDDAEALAAVTANAVEPSSPTTNEAKERSTDRGISRRTKLPVPRAEFKISLWTLLKGCIGRDLSRISLPVYFNEPTSLLQRITEDYQYSHILKMAAAEPVSTDRLLWVSIFTITPYASALGRTYKPFNPLLGETFEFSHRGFRYVAEQVGHHPPVCAYYCDNEDFAAWGSMAVTNRFTGKSLEIAMPGTAHIYLPGTPDKDHYTFGRGRMCINNIIFGKLMLEILGTVTVVNHITGDYSVIQFLRYGWWDTSRHVVRGIVFDRNGVAVYKIGGVWSKEIWVENCIMPPHYTPPSTSQSSVNRQSSLLPVAKLATLNEVPLVDPPPPVLTRPRTSICEGLRCLAKTPPAVEGARDEYNFDFASYKTDVDSHRVVWTAAARPPWSSMFYDFGSMTFELNEITPDYDPRCGVAMPVTDSRFRPDQRAYEDGDFELANEVKGRLEEAQRERARQRANGEDDHTPRWFYRGINSVTGEACWLFNGEYWKCKDNNNMTGGINIFDLTTEEYPSDITPGTAT